MTDIDWEWLREKVFLFILLLVTVVIGWASYGKVGCGIGGCI
jgi:hypothetical protein